MPVRIKRQRTKGWKLPENTISVCRPGRFGNPYRIGDNVCMTTARHWGWEIRHPYHKCENQAQAVNKFSGSVGSDPFSISIIKKMLRGKNLACFCELDEVCHADVLLEVANS